MGQKAAIVRHLGVNRLAQEDFEPDDFVRHSDNGTTVWVHSLDGSCVGRFDWRFGMDVHETVSAQLLGKSQCLHCTHEPPTRADWDYFCQLILQHHGIHVPRQTGEFNDQETLNIKSAHSPC